MHLKLDEAPFRSAQPPFYPGGMPRPAGYWHTTVERTASAPLEGNHTCDVLVIGGGFTGLSVAREVKRRAPDLDVVLIERAVIGHGASGRNGGFAMPLLGWDLVYAAGKLGETEAAEACRMTYAAVDHVKRTAAEEGIDCDLETTGYLMLHTCAHGEARSRRELALAERMGFARTWIEGDALDQYIRSHAFRSGLYDPAPCVLNPAKLACGLKRAAEAAGVRIFEQTPLIEFRDGATVEARTTGGVVRARQAVFALNGYSAAVNFLGRRVLPVHTYIVLTEPLTHAQLEGIGWAARRTSLETARVFIHYLRLTADNRILFGGEDADLYWNGQHRDADPRIFAALKARFRAYFPSLHDVQFTHEWGGVLGVTLDMFPSFGVQGAHRNVFHACGYSGHGVALSNYAGVILAPRMLEAFGRTVPDLPPPPFFWGRLPFPMPPEPLRFAGMKAYRWGLRALDWYNGA